MKLRAASLAKGVCFDSDHVLTCVLHILHGARCSGSAVQADV